jgi:hypothetical protein
MVKSLRAQEVKVSEIMRQTGISRGLAQVVAARGVSAASKEDLTARCGRGLSRRTLSSMGAGPTRRKAIVCRNSRARLCRKLCFADAVSGTVAGGARSLSTASQKREPIHLAAMRHVCKHHVNPTAEVMLTQLAPEQAAPQRVRMEAGRIGGGERKRRLWKRIIAGDGKEGNPYSPFPFPQRGKRGRAGSPHAAKTAAPPARGQAPCAIPQKDRASERFLLTEEAFSWKGCVARLQMSELVA